MPFEITKWIPGTRGLTRERGSEGMQREPAPRPILSPSVNVLKQSALFAAISPISISRRLSRSTPWATIYVVVRGCFDGGQPEVNLRFTRQYPPLTSTSSSTPQSCDEGGRRRGGIGALEKGTRREKKERKVELSRSSLHYGPALIILINKSPRTTDAPLHIYTKGITDLRGGGAERRAGFRIGQQ